MPYIGDGGPRPYRCVVCNRPAARYQLPAFYRVVDVCDACAYYVFTGQWGLLGQRHTVPPAEPQDPWPYPEHPPYPMETAP